MEMWPLAGAPCLGAPVDGHDIVSVSIQILLDFLCKGHIFFVIQAI